MENYLLNSLVVKLTDPWSGFQVSNSTINGLFHSQNIPSLLVAAKAEDLDNLEAILSEIVAEYTNSEKLLVCLIDGVKANLLDPVSTPAMQNAWVLTGSTSYRMSESFKDAKRGLKMTKQLLKDWLDYQISFISRRYPEVYTEDFKSSPSYTVVGNNKGEFKVWFYSESFPVPQGWEYFESNITDNIEKAIDHAKGCRAEYFERIQEVVDKGKSSVADFMESWFGDLNDATIIKNVVKDLAAFIETLKGFNIDITGQISPTDTIKTLRDCMLRASIRASLEWNIGSRAEQPYTDASIIRDIPDLVKVIEDFGSTYNLNFGKRVSPTDTVKTLRDRMVEVFLPQAGLK